MLMGMGRLTIRYQYMMYVNPFIDLLVISLDQVEYLSSGVHCRHEKKSEGARKC